MKSRMVSVACCWSSLDRPWDGGAVMPFRVLCGTPDGERSTLLGRLVALPYWKLVWNERRPVVIPDNGNCPLRPAARAYESARSC